MRNKFLLWTKIRSLGELQVLTKASYILLITIPLLAALWPGVKVVVNQYNSSINKTVSILEHSATRLEFESNRIENSLLNRSIPVNTNNISKDVKNIINNLEAQINEVKNDIAKSSIKSDVLPQTWALLFFAALFIFIAHLVYQLYAPNLIREKDIDDYVISKKEEYAKHPTERSLEFSKNMIKQFPTSQITLPPKPSKTTYAIDKDYDDKVKKWELNIIEAGFQSHYLFRAQENKTAVIISGVFYLLGVILILLVIIEQSISVAKSTGWLT